MASVKKNFAFNLILTGCNYIFPLITFPYVSRILGVTNIGSCDFVDSIINYFVLLSTLGVGSLGVREIAKCKNDTNKRNQVFSSLVSFNLVLTLIAIIILILLTFTLPKFIPYKPFLLVGLFKLLFTPLSIEWFFQGIQNFQYITIRSIIIRLLYVISVFIFLHDSSDAIIYYLLTTATIVLSSLCNLFYAKKFVTFSFKNINYSIYWKAILIFGYYRILTSMYTSFNSVFLGFITGDTEVGYFSTATKINSILMSVFTAFTTVMVPKVAEMIGEGRKSELQGIANNTLATLTACAIPIVLFVFLGAKDIVYLLAGEGYEGAVPVLRIVISLILVIGFEQVVIQQFLMASNSNKYIMYVSTTGAIIGISLNILLTPKFGSIGSAISWTASELSVLAVGTYLLNKSLQVRFPAAEIIKVLGYSIFYLIPLLPIFLFVSNFVIRIVLACIIVAVVFLLLNFNIKRNAVIVDSVYSFIAKFHTLLKGSKKNGC